jgi:DNA-binding LacI/PurR family transcriptional regulator
MPKLPHQPPTIKDVAESAGVSTATVSRVISGNGKVSKKLARRVKNTIDSLDFHPNQAARRLRHRKSKIVGVVLSDIQNPFFTSLVVGIESVLQEKGYLLILGNSCEDQNREYQHLNTFLSEQVSGIIFTSSGNDTSYYKKFLAAGIPLIAVDRRPPDLDVDSVQLANEKASFEAVNHLFSEGHRRIGLIAGLESLTTGYERREGYTRAFQAAGIPGDFRQDSGYRSMGALLDLADPPSAVLVSNNLMTLGALQKIHERNLNIPNQISIIGFDDIAWASSLRPPLTVIAQPVTEMGIAAANLLLDRIQNPDGPLKHLTFETRLIVRASCRCTNEGFQSAGPGIAIS